MKEYTIYFEIFGKKMKTKFYAKSQEEAKQIVLNRVVFHKVECIDDEIESSLNDIMNILGIKRK